MARQGTFKKSNWHNSLYVLTRYGFLHCFPLAHNEDKITDTDRVDPKNVKYTVNMTRPRVLVERSQVNVNCIEVSVPRNHKLFHTSDHKFLIKCQSQVEMKEWIDAMEKHLSFVKRDAPTLTVKAPSFVKQDEYESALVAQQEEETVQPLTHSDRENSLTRAPVLKSELKVSGGHDETFYDADENRNSVINQPQERRNTLVEEQPIM